MNQNKIDMINTYVEANIAPILIEEISADSFPNSVILSPNCGVESLNGHYEDIEFVAPKWYTEILEKKDSKNNILVIENITSIPLDDQLKFCEILKYRKISTFELPKNCVVILTCNKIDKSKISEQIYSLVVHIG